MLQCTHELTLHYLNCVLTFHQSFKNTLLLLMIISGLKMCLRLVHMMEGHFTKLLISRSILMFFPSNLACTIINHLLI